MRRRAVPLAALVLLAGCGSSGHIRRDSPTDPDTTGSAGAGGSGSDAPDAGAPALPRPDKVDLLLMLDNSRSMDVKHQLLSDAVQQLLRRLRTPDCVSATGEHTVARDAAGHCVAGQPEFEPVGDLHVAVITSSLGDAGGGQVCTDPEDMDMAHAMGSTARGAVQSMNGQGFLEWRSGGDEAAFDRDLELMISAVGQLGCGYEASLEAWYRFLVDPAPYLSLVRAPCSAGAPNTECVAPARDAEGQVLVDQVVLDQRAAFLRPDSLLLIVSLSDENDCSIRVGGQSWMVSTYSERMPRASSACAANPNSECCYSCAVAAPDGCAPDPLCASQPRLTEAEDRANLRCQEQKRRFGADFLYPTERYVRALTETKLCPSAPSLASASCPDEPIDNPLFAGGRPAEFISFTSIAGVPWQDIAAPAASTPDSFRPVADLTATDWEQLLGNPHASPPVPPADPFMQESVVPRAGIEPGNPINGREYDTSDQSAALAGPNDLEFACIFPLPAPIDCSELNPDSAACDCYLDQNDSPLCEARPGVDAAGTVQYFGKAYPGLRHLEVLQGVVQHGGNATLGSICPRNGDDHASPSFGYRPALQALLERVRPLLRAR